MAQTSSDQDHQNNPLDLFGGGVSLYLDDFTPCQPGILARIKERLFLPWMLEYMYR